MRRFRSLFSFILALTLLLCFAPGACALVEQSERFYVADAANVLTEQTEEMIINYNGALEQQCQGAQIVVVTTDYLDGMTSDAYAYQLFNDWGVGSAETNNGMLLLLAVQENKAWLAYGLGLTSRLSGSDVDRLLDEYFWKDFDNGRYDEAVNKLFPALLRFYDGVYGSSLAGAGGGSQNAYGNGGHMVQGLSDLIRLALIVAILVAIFGGRRTTRVRGGGSWLPWLLFFNSMNRSSRGGFSGRNNWPRGGGGFGGGGFGGGGFGGGMGRGGGGFSGGGGGRR